MPVAPERLTNSEFGWQWIDRNHQSSLLDALPLEPHIVSQLSEWDLGPEKKNLTLLDLSHNKLSGEINDLAFQVENSTLELQVNRLSGHLARSFDRYSNLDILATVCLWVVNDELVGCFCGLCDSIRLHGS
jgi:hypothetical protein